MFVYYHARTPEYIQEFVEWCCVELGIDKLRGWIDFKWHYGELDDNAFGLCTGDSREISIWVATRQFGEPISYEDKLKTTAHELVHARQYLKRELTQDPDEWDLPVSRWKGRKVHYGKGKYAENDTPWEREARRWEEKLFKKWMEEEV
jgi:hypothetical protein